MTDEGFDRTELIQTIFLLYSTLHDIFNTPSSILDFRTLVIRT
jgi:hypothetical protein